MPGRSAPRKKPPCYRHDSGISVTLGMVRGAPADRDRRRARPPGRPGPPPQAGLAAVPAVPAAEATRVLESEVNAAQFRAVYKRRRWYAWTRWPGCAPGW